MSNRIEEISTHECTQLLVFNVVVLCVTTYNALNVFRFECSRPVNELDEKSRRGICFILTISVSLQLKLEFL
jgi:hypothetical protein